MRIVHAISRMLFQLIQSVLRFFYPRPVCRGLNQIEHSPAIFVANHYRSHGPVTFFLYAPVTAKPWVIAPVTKLRDCREYVRKDFVENELRIRNLPARIIAFFISFFCVWIMRRVGAIPVYSGSRKIIDTMQQSLSELMAGKNLIIFIERRDDQDYQKDIGFLDLLDMYYRKTGNCLPLYILKISRQSIEVTGNFKKISSHEAIRKEVIALIQESNAA